MGEGSEPHYTAHEEWCWRAGGEYKESTDALRLKDAGAMSRRRRPSPSGANPTPRHPPSARDDSVTPASSSSECTHVLIRLSHSCLAAARLPPPLLLLCETAIQARSNEADDACATPSAVFGQEP